MATKVDPNFKWSEYDEDTGLTQCLSCKHVYNAVPAGFTTTHEDYCPNCDHWQGLEKETPEGD